MLNISALICALLEAISFSLSLNPTAALQADSGMRKKQLRIFNGLRIL